MSADAASWVLRTNDGGRHWSLRLRASAESDGEREHAENGGAGRHENRAESGRASGENG